MGRFSVERLSQANHTKKTEVSTKMENSNNQMSVKFSNISVKSSDDEGSADSSLYTDASFESES